MGNNQVEGGKLRVVGLLNSENAYLPILRLTENTK